MEKSKCFASETAEATGILRTLVCVKWIRLRVHLPFQVDDKIRGAYFKMRLHVGCEFCL
jgi:hypothetical protein